MFYHHHLKNIVHASVRIFFWTYLKDSSLVSFPIFTAAPEKGTCELQDLPRENEREKSSEGRGEGKGLCETFCIKRQQVRPSPRAWQMMPRAQECLSLTPAAPRGVGSWLQQHRFRQWKLFVCRAQS